MTFLLKLLGYACMAAIGGTGFILTVGFAAGGKGNELRPSSSTPNQMTALLAQQCDIISQVAYQAGLARDTGHSSNELKRYVRDHSDTLLNEDVETAIDMPYTPELRSMLPSDIATRARSKCIRKHTGER